MNLVCRRALIWTLVGLLSAFVIAFAGVTVTVGQAIRPVRLHTRRTPADDGISFEAMRFPARDGTRLAGWWVPVRNASGTVILCHGYPSNRADMAPLIPFLHRAGYNVLAYDFRRLGESDGEMCTVGLEETKDLLGAVDEAARRSPAPIGVLGWSMGAAVSLMTAAGDPRIRAVVADSSYASLDRMASRRWNALPRWVARPAAVCTLWLGQRLVGRPLSDASPLRATPRIAPRPILFIHSRHDVVIPCQDSQEMYAESPGPKQIWITDASGHVRNWAECTEEYRNRVKVFLRANLRSSRQPVSSYPASRVSAFARSQ